MGRILIAISGPKHGGKTTLALKIADHLFRTSISVGTFEYSSLLEEMIAPLRISGDKEDRRPYLIAIGNALESMDLPVSPLTERLLYQLTVATEEVFIVAGVGREEELLALEERARAEKRHFMHIHQSMHADKETNQTPPGETYPEDCRSNLMSHAHWWNPQIELLKDEICKLLNLDYGELPL